MRAGREITVEAPAKVNLWLRVLGRRESDGYHELDTRMVPLELADSLRIRELPAGRGLQFSCDDAGVPGGEGNLAVRAFRELERASGRVLDAEIVLQKRIPSGAGLGGGSSDAAAVLAAVNRLLALGIGAERLAAMAAGLGADVPFFLHGQPCDCRGVGEIIEPVGAVDPLSLLLVKPAFGVSTPWVYSRWKESRELPGIDYAEQATPWGRIRNDLERPVFEKYPVLGILKGWLRAREGVRAALLSGSGSTVFAILDERANPGHLATAAQREFGASTWCCPTRSAPGNPEPP
ncbi:4-(cytidine 5'-diphospho)-2-C-methyl-D-erythritol kinase [soil metagenome]